MSPESQIPEEIGVDRPVDQVENMSEGFRMPGKIASVIAALVAACSNPEPRGDKGFSYCNPLQSHIYFEISDPKDVDVRGDFKEDTVVILEWFDEEEKLLQTNENTITEYETRGFSAKFNGAGNPASFAITKKGQKLKMITTLKAEPIIDFPIEELPKEIP